MKKNAKLLKVLLIIVGLFIAGGIFFVYNQSRPVNKNNNDTVRVEIPSGMSVSKVADSLKENSLIKNSRIFYFCARFPVLRKVLFPKDDNSVQFVLRSGIYHISPSMTIPQIQNLLASGKQEFTKVSFPEGLSISKIAAILEENRICSAQDFKNAAKNTDLLKKYSIPADSFEGYLFPDTYYFNISMNAEDVVCIFADNFFEKIKKFDGITDFSSKKLFETVTLASIVEREYRVESEAPLIASVFKNRLKDNIGLYSCATIVYILTEIEGREHPERVLIEDTKIDNPYNTYKWAGLPPGPISNPGLVALDAVINTPKTNYYFFQVADQDQGKHVFTSTFEEHKINHNLSTKKAAGK